jgi:hypothetical protein
MAGSLDPVRAKLRRADTHRQDFAATAVDYLTRQPYSLAFNFDSDSGWHEFRWEVKEEPPVERLVLIFGDFLNNLRSTLDYLVWQLVLLNGEEPVAKVNAFPIVRLRQNWPAARRDQLRGVSPLCARKIRQLQPYRREDRPEVDPLAILDDVNNINKHRVLSVGFVSIGLWHARIFGTPGSKIQYESFPDEPIREGGLFYRFRNPNTRERLQFKSDPDPVFRVSFRNGVEIGWTNDDMFEFVAGVVRLFEPAFLPAHDSPPEV